MVDIKKRSIAQRSNIIFDLHEYGIFLDTREIFLGSHYNRTSEDAEVDHAMAHNFIRNLSLLNTFGNTPIIVHMISCGGDWNYGMAIYDAIKSSCDDPKLSDVIVVAYAHARSMSSIIPQAATYRIMMPNTEFLVHWGSFYFDGNHKSGISMAEECKRLENVMLDIYANRCINSPYWEQTHKIKTEYKIKEYIRAIIDKKQEWYMSAGEAVEMGFMDAVLGDDNVPTFSDITSYQR